jgi:hypothetical protein
MAERGEGISHHSGLKQATPKGFTRTRSTNTNRPTSLNALTGHIGIRIYESLRRASANKVPYYWITRLTEPITGFALGAAVPVGAILTLGAGPLMFEPAIDSVTSTLKSFSGPLMVP